MIRHIVLENWKAYRKLDMPFDEGTTFVIARNGIGKTSLVDGVMWALFGELSDADPASCLRSGSDATSAAVELRLGKEDVRITRAFSVESNKTEAAITVAGRTTAGSRAVERYLSQALGAEPAILARMCFLREGEAVGATTSETSNLHSHLERAFGVDTLVHLSAEEDRRRRRLTRDARSTRRTQRLADSARAQLTEKARVLETDLAALKDEHRAARGALAHAQQALATLTSWSEFDLVIERRAAELQNLLDRLSRELAITNLTQNNVLSRLALERSRQQTRLEELNRERGAVDAERVLLTNLVSTLGSGTGACPVCLRPINAEERHHAETLHADRISELDRRAAEIGEQAEATRAQLMEADRWTQEVNQALASPVPPTAPRPESWEERAIEKARQAVADATQSLEDVAGRLAKVEQEHHALEEELTRDAEAATLSTELFRRYREEALSELISTTLRRSAHEIVARRIDPLATEIQNRWKLLWPDRAPVRLRDDGSLVAVRGADEVPYREFSGGEKVISTLILRLLALSMTTTTPFLWLDEPLEHLDPRNRRMVASLLVKASLGDGTRQIVATTYEEAVARRLDESQAAHLVYVDAEPDA